MALHCPFCHNAEEKRIKAEDEDQRNIVLLIFDCPFFLQVEPSKLTSEEVAQKYLDDWREKHGEEWLDGMGHVLRERELRNIQRFEGAKLTNKSL